VKLLFYVIIGQDLSKWTEYSFGPMIKWENIFPVVGFARIADNINGRIAYCTSEAGPDNAEPERVKVFLHRFHLLPHAPTSKVDHSVLIYPPSKIPGIRESVF
jgi:hypothetical protein